MFVFLYILFNITFLNFRAKKSDSKLSIIWCQMNWHNQNIYMRIMLSEGYEK